MLRLVIPSSRVGSFPATAVLCMKISKNKRLYRQYTPCVAQMPRSLHMHYLTCSETIIKFHVETPGEIRASRCGSLLIQRHMISALPSSSRSWQHHLIHATKAGQTNRSLVHLVAICLLSRAAEYSYVLVIIGTTKCSNRTLAFSPSIKKPNVRVEPFKPTSAPALGWIPPWALIVASSPNCDN